MLATLLAKARFELPDRRDANSARPHHAPSQAGLKLKVTMLANLEARKSLLVMVISHKLRRGWETPWTAPFCQGQRAPRISTPPSARFASRSRISSPRSLPARNRGRPRRPLCGAWRRTSLARAGRRRRRQIFRDDALRLVLPAACGVELAHAASLVLDDLPSMDDAASGAARPAPIAPFPAWAADMAPVFMVTLAYQISLDNPHVPAAPASRLRLSLARRADDDPGPGPRHASGPRRRGGRGRAPAPLLSAEKRGALWRRRQDGWHPDRRRR